MRGKLDKAVLGRAYALAMWLRARWWRLRQPQLFGVRVLAVRGGEVLLVRHRAGSRPWSLPGGGVERHERLIEAARREFFEETGAPLRIDRLMGVYDSFYVGISNYIAVFVGTPLADQRPPRSLEIAEARFFSLGALPEGLDRSSGERIAEYLAGRERSTGLW